MKRHRQFRLALISVCFAVILLINGAWAQNLSIANQLQICKQQLENQLTHIIEQLDLHPVAPNDIIGQLNTALKVARFVVHTVRYDLEIQTYKHAILDDHLRNFAEIYTAVFQKRAVRSGYSLLAQELLTRLGVEVRSVFPLDPQTGLPVHAINVIHIGEQWYLFDLVLEQQTHQAAAVEYHRSYNPDNPHEWDILYACGLGTRLYSQVHSLEGATSWDGHGYVTLPKPIATDGLTQAIIRRHGTL